MNSLNIHEVLTIIDKDKPFFLRELQKICEMPREYLHNSDNVSPKKIVEETLYMDDDNFSKENVEAALDYIFSSISM